MYYTVNNYMQVTGIATGENFAFFIYTSAVGFNGIFKRYIKNAKFSPVAMPVNCM